MTAGHHLDGPSQTFYEGNKKEFVEHIRKVVQIYTEIIREIHYLVFSIILTCIECFQALYASKIISYAQGFMLMREVSKQFSWKLNFGNVALMWRGGCIIRR